MIYYLTTLLVYGAVDVMACLGLSQQFGIAGVTNFGFILFQAAGAYAAAILSLPSDTTNGAFQSYLGGWHLPFPLPLMGAAVAGGLVAVPFVLLAGRRLRGDFAAVGLLVAAVMANLLVQNYRPFLNGDAGLSLVPAPFSGVTDPQSAGYQWAYAAGAVVLAFGVYRFVRRITESPYGRTLRAMRDNDRVADALGKNLLALRLAMLVLGGAIAGLSGGVLVGFINLWAPSAWTYAETIVLFAAVIIGGRGNHLGAVLGAVVVPLGFEEATRFLPSYGPPGLIPALQWVAIGLLIVMFLWLRPQGVLPERRRVTRRPRHNDPQRTVRRKALSLECEGITVSFRGVVAVDGVSLTFPPGRITGIIGPNGAGKTSLLGALAGTLTPAAGTVRLGGRDITRLPSFRRARAGVIRTFQLAAEFKRLTVLENLLVAAPAQRDTLRAAVAGRRYWRRAEPDAWAMLDRFDFARHANDPAGDLSGGQRRLVEIMRALMARPAVLLLDEPMAGLHPDLAATIGAELRALAADGLAIAMVEHELSIMDEFCDTVVMMADGAVLAEGTMAALRARPDVLDAYIA